MSKHKIEYNNPIVMQRADPWVYKHTDGYYYFTGSVPGYQEIEVRRAETLNDLEHAERASVWFAHESGPQSHLIWAPEVHYIRGRWYIYYAAAPDSDSEGGVLKHRMYVLECKGEDPLADGWTERGQIKTHQESFSLDATVFEHRNQLYYVWAQKEPVIPGHSNLYIAEMENPWTLKGKSVIISIPEYDWERVGFWVNEGPAVLKRNGKIFIAYSGSATDENYVMGLLWAEEEADLLDGYSWHKKDRPVFKSAPDNGKFGPGHNSFTVSEDGCCDVIVYHARTYTEIEGDPLDNPDRHACAQVFDWDEHGFPVFGEPVPDSRL